MSPVSSASVPSRMPKLPLTCLRTAEYTSTSEAFEGKNVVVDFWTTKCIRCPAALDDLDDLSRRPEYANVQFVSVCLDSCDGARNIIEKDDVPRWGNVHHYHMEVEYKETAKAALGFAQVPFYVVLNDRGEIVMKGSKKKVDFDSIPGMVRPVPMTSPGELDEQSRGDSGTPTKKAKAEDLRSGQSSPISVQEMEPEERVFVIDEDFDF